MISLLALFWYGLIPLTGALVSCYTWRRFRRYFNRLRLAPLLDYARYVGCGKAGADPSGAGESPKAAQKLFRFAGGFESITDRHTLWVRGPDLTIPVVLTGAQIYMLPMGEGNEREILDPREEVPQRLRWDRVATLTAEARVFVGGALTSQDERWTFAATTETPLQIIFYTGSDRSMAIRTIRMGRLRNEYWNSVTPYALILGALCLIAAAFSFLPRPAFRLTVITAFAAVFIPLFPLVPPGLLFTLAYRWLWQRSRIYRAFRDLVRLPLVYASGRLPGGESYGARRYQELPGEVPLLAPGLRKVKGEPWYVFGILGAGEGAEGAGGDSPAPVPREPGDGFATFGAVPGDPEKLSRRCAWRAYVLGALAWLLLIGGIGLNALFIAVIISLL